MTDAEVVGALFAAFARRDADAAARWIAPDADFWPQGTGARIDRDVIVVMWSPVPDRRSTVTRRERRRT